MNLTKPSKIRSKKIRKSAKGEACTMRIPGVCNHNNETVVLCHAPSIGKGTGTKSDDFWGAYGCSDCHDCIDRRNNYAVTDDIWLRAIFETQKKLIEKGIIEIK